MLVARNHPNLLHVDQALLVVIDMQEPFLRNVYENDRVVQNVSALVRWATTLRIPTISTTQYAEKMGDVIDPIKSLLSPIHSPYDKMVFSCYGAPAFASELHRSARKQIILCGVESHICVSQTAHDLAGAGFQVQVAVDAISSRTEANWKLGIDKMRQAGVIVTSVEAAAYELLHAAGTPEFREVLKIIK